MQKTSAENNRKNKGAENKLKSGCRKQVQKTSTENNRKNKGTENNRKNKGAKNKLLIFKIYRL